MVKYAVVVVPLTLGIFYALDAAIQVLI
jgi:hypothetical protein